MRILIAGITGNIGQHAARHGLATGHSIRGLGRSPSKLDTEISAKLESFVVTSTYYDIAALDAACRPSDVDGTKVDAVICAYAGMPELHLDAQLLLLRAAERAGIKRFLAAGWNYDWRKIGFGDEPVYDAAIAFHRQVELTSAIRPLHIFSGMLAEVFFGVDGQAGFTPADRGVWDPVLKSIDVWGDGRGQWNFTTEGDAGRWGVEVVAADDAEQGGFISLCSWSASLIELKKMYEELRPGIEVKVNCRGSTEELEKNAIAEKKEFGYRNMWDWHRLWFMLFSLKGVWNLSDLQNAKYPNAPSTSFHDFLKEHHEI